MVEELHNGVEIDSTAVRALRYKVPSMSEHEILEYLAPDELRFVGGELENMEYDNLTE